RRAGVDRPAGPGCQRPGHVSVRGDLAWAQAARPAPVAGSLVLSDDRGAAFAVSTHLVRRRPETDARVGNELRRDLPFVAYRLIDERSKTAIIVLGISREEAKLLVTG